MSSLAVLSSLIASVAAPVQAPLEAPQDVWSFHLDHVLGTSFDMAVAAPTQAHARFAFAAASAEIARLDKTLSGWRDDSELARLNRAGDFAASSDLFAVVDACERWRGRTGGVFSARLGAVEAALDAGDLAAACDAADRAERASVGLEPNSLTVRRPVEVSFAVDGLAKGYIIDKALAAARRAAPCATGVLVDIGGDIACWGDRAWRVGVADPAQLADNAPPLATLAVRNAALAVSGPGLRDRVIGGEPTSHLLDPATGRPAARRQAAVLAPDAATADALSTALAVMSPKDGLALAARHSGVEVMIVEGAQRWTTEGWQAACQAAQALPAGFAVEVSYETPKIDAPNYKKPYVIVWVTDADKNPIKTLLIQGARKDWQEGNYVWWRRYGRKDPAQIDALAKPTRPPGRYTVGWDGTDQAGKRVAQGKYLIHIEAAREHGGHAYQTIEIDLGPAPATGQAAAKDELAAAQIRYGKSK